MRLTESNIADEVTATRGPNAGAAGILYNVSEDGSTVYVGHLSGEHWEDAVENWVAATRDASP